jgi:hypothetical protein
MTRQPLVGEDGAELREGVAMRDDDQHDGDGDGREEEVVGGDSHTLCVWAALFGRMSSTFPEDFIVHAARLG